MTRSRAARRTPSQDRSRELVESVREACRQVLAEYGHDGLTTARIAERAGVSVGSLYQYFDDKEHILSDVFREALNEQMKDAADWSADLRERPLSEQMRVGLRHAAANYRGLLELDACFFRGHHADYQMELEFPSPETADRSRAEAGAVSYTRANLERNQDQLRPERVASLDHAAFLVGRGIPAILRAALEDDPELLQDETFLEEVFDLMDSYLTRPSD